MSFAQSLVPNSYRAAFVLAGLLSMLAVEAKAASGFVVLDDPTLLERSPSVAYNSGDGSFLVVWYNDRAGNDDIRGQRVNRDGTLLGPSFYISAGAGADRRFPDVAYDSRNDQYLVVWEHYDTTAGYGIHGRRVSGNGVVQDASDIVIRAPGSLYSAAHPAVAYAYTSDTFMVVWAETWHPLPINYSIVAQVVSNTGALSGSSVTVTSDSDGNVRSRPDIAYNRRRNENLVVWQQLAKSAGIDDVVAQRVTAAGVLLGGPIPIAYYTVSTADPVVAALPNVGTEGQYLVAFSLDYDGPDWDIYSRFVSGDGTAAGSDLKLATTGAKEALPAVSGQELTQRYLLTWNRYSESTGLAELIEGTSVEFDGAFEAATAIGGVAANSSEVAAESDGSRFMIAFEDDPGASGATGVYGALFDPVFADDFESGDTSAWSSVSP